MQQGASPVVSMYCIFVDAVVGSIDTHVHEEVEDETQRMVWKPGLGLEWE